MGTCSTSRCAARPSEGTGSQSSCALSLDALHLSLQLALALGSSSTAREPERPPHAHTDTCQRWPRWPRRPKHVATRLAASPRGPFVTAPPLLRRLTSLQSRESPPPLRPLYTLKSPGGADFPGTESLPCPPLPCPGPLLDLPRTPTPPQARTRPTSATRSSPCCARPRSASAASRPPLQQRGHRSRRDAPRCAEMRRDAARCARSRRMAREERPSASRSEPAPRERRHRSTGEPGVRVGVRAAGPVDGRPRLGEAPPPRHPP